MTSRPISAACSAANKVLSLLENVALAVAAFFLLAMMVLVSLDSVMRYFFNNPLVFQYTLTEDYLLVGLIMMALSWGFRTGGYIRIVGIAAMLPRALELLLIRAGLIVSTGYIAVLAWTSGKHFLDVFASGEAKIGVIDWPIWLSWLWVPLGLGLLTLRLLLTAIGPWEELLQSGDELPEDI